MKGLNYGYDFSTLDARSCTFAHARFCILAHQKCACTKKLCFHPLDGRCKVQDLAHLHAQDFAFLQIKNVKVPRHYVISPPRCKVQRARSCTCKILHSCTSVMCKYCNIMLFLPLDAWSKVQDLLHFHVQDFAFLHIKNVQVPRYHVFHPQMQGAKCKILNIFTSRILHFFT